MNANASGQRLKGIDLVSLASLRSPPKRKQKMKSAEEDKAHEDLRQAEDDAKAKVVDGEVFVDEQQDQGDGGDCSAVDEATQPL